MERQASDGIMHPILYVDDEEANRVVFASTVGRHFETLIAASGAEALVILKARPIEVLITDNRMPGMDGIELCEKVKEWYPEVPRVLLTAYSDLKTVSAAINRGGVYQYLTKPWNLREIVAVIREASSTARIQRLGCELQTAMLAQERMTALAATRGQVLHDLANAASLVMASCDGLESVASEARQHLPDSVGAVFLAEVGDLRRAADYLSALHTRVRGLNRTGEPEWHLNDVAELIQTAVVVARGHLPRSSRIEVNCPPGTMAWCDHTDLGRILVNLVSNAAQALAGAKVAEGCIRITAERVGPLVRIVAADNGPGIPLSLRTKVFESQFTTRRGVGGSGLGLAISRQLALDNGGLLELVDSDVGARFVLSLPASPEAIASHG